MNVILRNLIAAAAALGLLLPAGCGPAEPGPAGTRTATKQDTMQQQFQAEARGILRFWQEHTVDEENGGFFGRIDTNNVVQPQAGKGAVLNTRILWTFSAAARHFGDPAYRATADRAYRYILDHFIDREHGGVYWMLDYQGNPVDPKKQVYAEAFAIYALSEYYLLTQDKTALDEATAIYRLLEQHSFDPADNGYLEAFNRDWTPTDDMRLSTRDANAVKTMNTHLHVLEAYTNLYRAWKDPGLKRQLRNLIEIHLDRILNPATHHLQLFFDDKWQVQGDEISYGHDIEAAWLLTEAAEVLGDQALLERVEEEAVKIAGVTLAEGLDADGGLLYEASPHGYTNTEKHWWPQAEAMVGFYNAYQLSGDPRFEAAAFRSWAFIKDRIIDHERGEWRWGVTREGAPLPGQDKTGPWKAPYHNTRGCLEMMRRVGE